MVLIVSKIRIPNRWLWDCPVWVLKGGMMMVPFGGRSSSLLAPPPPPRYIDAHIVVTTPMLPPVWHDIYELTRERSLLPVLIALTVPFRKLISRDTFGYTQGRSLSSARIANIAPTKQTIWRDTFSHITVVSWSYSKVRCNQLGLGTVQVNYERQWYLGFTCCSQHIISKGRILVSVE